MDAQKRSRMWTWLVTVGPWWLHYLKCSGSRPATNPFRQYCMRLRWHPGQCLAPIDGRGKNYPHGAKFTPTYMGRRKV